MRGIKRFLFGDGTDHLSEEVRLALTAWRDLSKPSLDDVHFQTRYVVLDIATSGGKPGVDTLLGIAASALRRGVVSPRDAFFLSFPKPDSDTDTQISDDVDRQVERQLIAFLQFSAKAPIVTYHTPFVGGFLQRAYKDRFGLNFQPPWIDLAWLLPSLFEEKAHSIKPLDFWVEAFGLDAGSGRRSTMENNLLLARLFQILLVRAKERDIDTAAQLIGESHAGQQLMGSH